MAGIPVVVPPGNVWQPVSTGANGIGVNAAQWNAKTFLVAGLLLIFLLMLATRFPSYTTGFMVLLLIGVVLTHVDIIQNFFNV